MKKIAVLVYIPNKKVYINQFFALYASVVLQPKLKANIDFLIACEEGNAHLYKRDNCQIIYRGDLSKSYHYMYDLKPYSYINSWIHFNDNHSIDIIKQYQYALRLDIDTFIAPNILNINLKQGQILVGNGGYIGNTTKENLLRVANDLNIRHRGIHNIGSTWFGFSQDIIDVGRVSLQNAQYLLKNEFKQQGVWPEWYAPVTTMYAGELALNDSNLSIEKTPKLDARSDVDSLNIHDIYTIHCWHTETFFSKFKYEKGLYNDINLPINIETPPNYAHFFSRISELIQHDKAGSENQPIYSYTPVQAFKIGIKLVLKSLPYLPIVIINKIYRILISKN